MSSRSKSLTSTNSKKGKPTTSTSDDKNPPESCTACDADVGENDKGLECEICKKWWHAGCVDIKDLEYDMLSRHEKGSIHWYCPLCNIKTMHMVKLIQTLNDRMSYNENQLDEIKLDIQNRMQSINTTLNGMQADIAMLRKDIDQGQAQQTIITEMKNDVEKVKTQNFADIVQQEMRKMEGEVNMVKKTLEETREGAEEEREREMRKNNIIIYRMKESVAPSAELRQQEDSEMVGQLLQSVLELPYDDGNVKKIIRLGKKQENTVTDRPVLVEFSNRTVKNYVMENLNKLGKAEKKFKDLSITYDMTPKEREYCKQKVEEAKIKEDQEGQGEYIFRVRGPPGKLEIKKFRKRN